MLELFIGDFSVVELRKDVEWSIELAIVSDFLVNAISSGVVLGKGLPTTLTNVPMSDAVSFLSSKRYGVRPSRLIVGVCLGPGSAASCLANHVELRLRLAECNW